MTPDAHHVRLRLHGRDVLDDVGEEERELPGARTEVHHLRVGPGQPPGDQVVPELVGVAASGLPVHSGRPGEVARLSHTADDTDGGAPPRGAR